jgi:superfamily I DNA/RNA helicase
VTENATRVAGGFCLTDEQQRVVASQARRLAIEAGAGAAKTSTLVAYAQARPKEQMLYLAFNRSIAEDAKGRMPPNVHCRTMHSLAWRKACELFGDSDAAIAKVGNVYPSAAARAVGCTPLVATGALAAIQAWAGSDDDELGEHHLPPAVVQRTQDPESLMQAAQALRGRMLDAGDASVLMPHDVYLKLFQLDRPQLSRYATLLTDEAQDTSASTFALLRDQRARLVLVGDSAQAIYTYRGTTDALRLLDADERLPLTRSFRFGEGVATMANALLFAYRTGHRHRLVGAGNPRQTALTFDLAQPHAVLARTNAALFDAAVQALHMNRRYHFVGGVEAYRFDKLVDAFHLWVGELNQVRDPYLRSFRSFQELEELAESADERELKRLAATVLAYQRDVPALVDRICSMHVDLEARRRKEFGGIYFSTAHRSKGLEFERVWLADDYQRLMNRGNEVAVDDVEPQEINVLYVALTRTRAAVRLNDDFSDWLRHRGVIHAA